MLKMNKMQLAKKMDLTLFAFCSKIKLGVISMAIEVQLKKLRKKKKLSMAQTAEALGIPKGTYATYEYGTREPNIGMINKIADFYEVSADSLLGREVKEADELITEIEELPPQGKAAIKKVVDMLKIFRESEKATRDRYILLTTVGEVLTALGAELDSETNDKTE